MYFYVPKYIKKKCVSPKKKAGFFLSVPFPLSFLLIISRVTIVKCKKKPRTICFFSLGVYNRKTSRILKHISKKSVLRCLFILDPFWTPREQSEKKVYHASRGFFKSYKSFCNQKYIYAFICVNEANFSIIHYLYVFDKVRWPSGRKGNYRFGYNGKFDVEVW